MFKAALLPILPAVVLAAAAAVPALGQTTRDTHRPLGDPLNLGERQALAPRDAGPAENPGDYQATSPFWKETYAGPAPYAEIRRVPEARAAFVATNWTFITAETNFNNLFRQADWAFRNSPDYQQAQAAVDRAGEAYRAARNEALAPLADDEDYQSLARLLASLDAEIREENAAETPSQSRLTALAGARLEAAQRMSAAEADLLATAPVAAALQRLRDAGNQLAALKFSHEQALRNDPRIAQARQAVQQLRIAKNTAAAYLDSTVNARNLAVRFAAYERRLDRYTPRLASPYFDDHGSYGTVAYDSEIGYVGNRPYVQDLRPVSGR
ncbi:MAG: hypothetical protein ACFCVE_15940 [Phycisphaerae bacterium]